MSDLVTATDSIRATRSQEGTAVVRSLSLLVFLGLVLVGCVSVGPASPSATSPSPSLGITTPAAATPTAIAATPTPTAAATPTVAATPTLPSTTETPSAEATGTPGTLPSVEPSPGTIEDYGATTLLFTDDFSDATSGWGVGSSAGGTVAYVDGALQFDPAAATSWQWSRRLFDTTQNVLHAEATFEPSSPGFQGLLCANSDDELYGAVAGGAGIWAFIKLTSAGASILSSNAEAGWVIPAGEATRLTLDCAGTATGQFRMQFAIPDTGLAVQYEGTEGALSFDRVGIYGEAGPDPSALRVDDLAAYGGTGDVSMSPAAQALLTHVPTDWQQDCFESPGSFFETGAEATLNCTLTDGRSDIAEYTKFDTKENMDAAYQTRVDTWSVESQGSCQSGPNETSYSIGGTPAGRILCAPQTVGIRVDWTFDTPLILSTLTDFEGSYADTYQDWLVAGPN